MITIMPKSKVTGHSKIPIVNNGFGRWLKQYLMTFKIYSSTYDKGRIFYLKFGWYYQADIIYWNYYIFNIPIYRKLWFIHFSEMDKETIKEWTT